MNSPDNGPVTWSFDIFLCQPGQANEKRIVLSVIWNVNMLMWRGLGDDSVTKVRVISYEDLRTVSMYQGSDK